MLYTVAIFLLQRADTSAHGSDLEGSDPTLPTNKEVTLYNYYTAL